MLISSCFSAQRRITIVTPYFVPDATVLMALTLAARRGVAVDVVLPAKSNHRLADAGAVIWLCPGMVHAKAVLVDEDLPQGMSTASLSGSRASVRVQSVMLLASPVWPTRSPRASFGGRRFNSRPAKTHGQE